MNECKVCKTKNVMLFAGRCFKCKWQRVAVLEQKARLKARQIKEALKVEVLKQKARIKAKWIEEKLKRHITKHKRWPQGIMYDREAVRKLYKKTTHHGDPR